MNPPAAHVSLERLAALEAWRAIEQPACELTRERVRVLELAGAKLAGAAFVGSILGGGLMSVLVAYISKGA